MTITIDLSPEETTRLTAAARRQGVSLEGYLYRRVSHQERPPKRSIRDLQGLGKEIRQGVDVRQYLDGLRDGRE